MIASDNFGKGGTDPALVPNPDDPTSPVKPTIEREVYFVAPSTNVALPPMVGKIQYCPSKPPTNAAIQPGGYAVIGPGETKSDPGYQPDPSGTPHPNRTYIGFLTGGTAGTIQTRNIDLDLASSGSLLPVQNNKNIPGNADPNSTTIHAPVTVAIDSCVAGAARLSVSEPIKAAGAASHIVYDDYENNARLIKPNFARDHNGKYVNGSASAAVDIPFDQPQAGDDADTTTLKTSLKTNQHVPTFRMIYLQRLANPLKAYNGDPTSADYNPYRTIDSMPVDLTVFNGVTDQKDPIAGDNTTVAHFETQQRGEHNFENDPIDSTGLNQNMNLWTQEMPVDKTVWDTTSHDVTGHYFNKGLKHSLGYLNQPFGPPEMNNVTQEQGLPALNGKYGPFPWLTWNNRPYVSPLELMLVPWAPSSQLLGKYKIGQPGSPYTDHTVPFPHLMNLFPSGAPGSPDEELHRILEYLGVPSPFAGTDVWASPTAAQNGPHAFHPPFNRISTYREPGRINLNTIYEPDVFAALMAGAGAGAKPSWPDFVKSRSGGAGTNILDMPAVTSPTEFAHPFRSFAGATMIPALTGDPLKPKYEIDATLLREGGTPTAPTGQPLFNFTSTAPNACDNTDRNPYFHYQALQRLENLVTTRSNVFAVWITVGYFEVTPAPATLRHDDGSTSASTTPEYQAVYPGGYQLGAELGLDTGEVVRHRAFYIIDRTLPVGFKRGLDLNTDKAILVNRFIE